MHILRRPHKHELPVKVYTVQICMGLIAVDGCVNASCTSHNYFKFL